MVDCKEDGCLEERWLFAKKMVVYTENGCLLERWLFVRKKVF